jgi:hypothetical protein
VQVRDVIDDDLVVVAVSRDVTRSSSTPWLTSDAGSSLGASCSASRCSESRSAARFSSVARSAEPPSIAASTARRSHTTASAGDPRCHWTAAVCRAHATSSSSSSLAAGKMDDAGGA